MARLALVADHLGVPEARQIALASMETALTPWLLGDYLINDDDRTLDANYIHPLIVSQLLTHIP